jgi:hypothetical protein
MPEDDWIDAYIYDALRSTGTVRTPPTRRPLARGTTPPPVRARPTSAPPHSVVSRTTVFDEEDTQPDMFVGNDLSDLDERGVRRSR